MDAKPKRKRKRRHKYADDLASVFLRVHDVTRKKIRVIKEAEGGIPIQDLVDLLVTEYIVKRGLESAVAKIITNAEAAQQARVHWEKELREKWEKEKADSLP